MIYILIVMWLGKYEPTSLAVEFNSMASCQSAAQEIRRQDAYQDGKAVATILCAEKGKL